MISVKSASYILGRQKRAHVTEGLKNALNTGIAGQDGSYLAVQKLGWVPEITFEEG